MEMGDNSGCRAALDELARMGAILEIQKQVLRLEAMGAAYIPFAHKLQALAKRFEIEQITVFVKQFLRRSKMSTVEPELISSIDPQACTLLIVDDTDYLADYGFQIKVVQTGETGLERARLAQPDLILLDVRLPNIIPL